MIIELMARVVTDFSFYPLAHAIRGYYFIVLIVPTTICLGLIWDYCPETKGKPVN